MGRTLDTDNSFATKIPKRRARSRSTAQDMLLLLAESFL